MASNIRMQNINGFPFLTASNQPGVILNDYRKSGDSMCADCDAEGVAAAKKPPRMRVGEAHF